MPPKVSVIIAFLDGANYIQQAIDSVFAQTLEDCELILVDDGSDDASSELACSIAEHHDDALYLSHPGHANRGIAESRALGAAAATGEYLIFLDHDDIFYPNALQRMVDCLDANPNAIAVFAGVLFWAFDPSLNQRDNISTYGRLGSGLVPGPRVLRDLIRSDAHHPANCSTLYRRTAYLAAGAAGPTYPGMYEETAVLFKLLTHGDVYLLDTPVAAYRMHAGSMCQRAKAEGTLSDQGYSEDRYRFLLWAAANVSMDRISRAHLSAMVLWFRLQRRLIRRPSSALEV